METYLLTAVLARSKSVVRIANPTAAAVQQPKTEH